MGAGERYGTCAVLENQASPQSPPEVLEHIGTTDASQLLQEMAKGTPNPKVMEAAAASALLRIAMLTAGMP